MYGAQLQWEKFEPEGDTVPSREGRWLNVLVVDDDHLNREMLSAFLRHASVHVTEANNGLDARRKIEFGNYDLVISDIDMPGLDGFALLEWIKKHNENIEVIMVSGRTEMDRVLQAMRLGASDYLSKPYRREQLFAAVDRCREKLQKNIAPNQVLAFVKQSMHDVRHGLSDLAALVKRQQKKVPANNHIPQQFTKSVHTKIESLLSTTEDFCAEAMMLAQSGQASSDMLLLKRDVIDKVLRSVAWEIEDKCLSVQRIEKLDADAVKIKANGLVIRSALRNLLDNAIKQAPEQGTLTLKLENGGKYFLLSVENRIMSVKKSISPMEMNAIEGGARIPARCVDSSCLQGQEYGLEMSKYFAGLCGGDVWQEEHGDRCKYVLALPAATSLDPMEAT